MHETTAIDPIRRPRESDHRSRHRHLPRDAGSRSTQTHRRSGDSIRFLGSGKSRRRCRSFRPRSNAPLAHRLRLSQGSRHPPSSPPGSRCDRQHSSRNRPPTLRRRPSHDLALAPPGGVTARRHEENPCGGVPGTPLCRNHHPAPRRDPHNDATGLPRAAPRGQFFRPRGRPPLAKGGPEGR